MSGGGGGDACGRVAAQGGGAAVPRACECSHGRRRWVALLTEALAGRLVPLSGWGGDKCARADFPMGAPKPAKVFIACRLLNPPEKWMLWQASVLSQSLNLLGEQGALSLVMPCGPQPRAKPPTAPVLRAPCPSPRTAGFSHAGPDGKQSHLSIKTHAPLANMHAS